MEPGLTKYQVYFDTSEGEFPYRLDIKSHETLDKVLPEMIAELREEGHLLRGGAHGRGEVVVRWNGEKLDLGRPLGEQGVRPNEVLHVTLEVPKTLYVERDGQWFEVTRPVELEDDDLVLVGSTALRFRKRRRRKTTPPGSPRSREHLEARAASRHLVYNMTLVGAAAGLLTWFIASILALLWAIPAAAVDPLNLSLLGLLLGGATVAFGDRLTGEPSRALWILLGGLIGAAGGGLVGWGQSTLRGLFGGWFWLGNVAGWALAGITLGLVITLRWLDVNPMRVLLGGAGGAVGGLVGGLVFWLAGRFAGDLSQALAFLLTAAGITLAVSLAPALVRQGLLELVASEDRVVVQKMGIGRTWELHAGGKYVIGSMASSRARTVLAPEVQVFLPAQDIANRHAIVANHRHRFLLEPHPDLLREEEERAPRSPAWEHTQ